MVELCGKITCDDDNLKVENPILYYLKNIDDPEIMYELRWEDPYFYDYILRLHYTQSLTNKEPI